VTPLAIALVVPIDTRVKSRDVTRVFSAARVPSFTN